MEGCYHASIASVRDSDLLNVRFGPLCGLKSDIATCPKSAKTGREQMQQKKLFDYLVGESEQLIWYGEAERSGTNQIDYKIEFRRLLDWDFCRFGPA